MQKWIAHYTFAFAFLIIPSICCADVNESSKTLYQQGVAAYEQGDYAKAERLFKVLALKGQAESQRMLGNMYDKGLGVPQNFNKAVSWYREAAKQNDPAAQYFLGLKYANGHGVVENPREAYIWFAIAFNNGYELAANPLRVLNKSLSTVDRQEALKVVAQKMDAIKR